jgi:hypothetical protein
MPIFSVIFAETRFIAPLSVRTRGVSRLRQLSIITERRGKNVFLPLELVQLCVLRLGFVEDGDVRVGVFPEGEEVLVGG